MLTITIKTPLVHKKDKVNNLTPHLLEHASLLSIGMTSSGYFWPLNQNHTLYFDTYTKVALYGKCSRQKFLAIVSQPPEKAIFDRERKTLQEELLGDKHRSFTKTYWALYAILSWHTRGHQRKPSYEELIQYQKQYYVKENIVVSKGDTGKLLFVGDNFKIAHDSNCLGNKSPLKWELQNTIYYAFPYSNRKDHQNAILFYEVMRNYFRFHFRFQKWVYYHEKPVFMMLPKHIIITMSDQHTPAIDESFFDMCKQYYLKNFSILYDSYRKVIDLIHGYGYTDTVMAKTYVSSIDYTKFLFWQK